MKHKGADIINLLQRSTYNFRCVVFEQKSFSMWSRYIEIYLSVLLPQGNTYKYGFVFRYCQNSNSKMLQYLGIFWSFDSDVLIMNVLNWLYTKFSKKYDWLKINNTRENVLHYKEQNALQLDAYIDLILVWYTINSAF